jgi:molybdopterin-guanine dinucleotide biosynthesis protein A
MAMERQAFVLHGEPVALVVNAGGQSLRMGRAKALLPMPKSGKPLITHILDRLSPYISGQVIVVTNDAAVAEAVSGLENVRILADDWREGGALGGLATGLAAAPDWAMAVACDMPFVEPAIFAKLIDVARSAPELDAVIPRVAGQAQSFHGLWHHRALPSLVSRLEAGKLSVQGALGALNVAWMDERALTINADTLAFYNVNTPADWQTAKAILEKQEGPLAK